MGTILINSDRLLVTPLHWHVVCSLVLISIRGNKTAVYPDRPRKLSTMGWCALGATLCQRSILLMPVKEEYLGR